MNLSKIFILTFLFIFSGLEGQVINEVLYNPITNDGVGGMNGEWIELAGITGTDVSGFILSDGDWTVVIPSTTLIPSDGFLAIGFNGFAEGGTMDLDLTMCSCIGGSGITLTNGGEFVALFDPSQNFVDGVIFDGPSAGNTPGTDDSSAPLPGGGTLTIPADNETTNYEEITSGAGDGISVARNPDVTGGYVLSSALGGTSPGGSNILPVDLMKFDVLSNHHNVFINWLTSTEINNDYFTIEHSIDGKSFSEIGKVKGNGTTADEKEYSFVHRNPSPGINYYRLMQTDFNGQFEIFPSKSIVVNRIVEEATIYPTVSADYVNIDLKKEENGNFEILNIVGEKVLIGDLNNQLSRINISNLANGHYIVKINTNGQFTTQRLIKQ